MNVDSRNEREFVRTFFTSPAAVEGEDNSAKMLQSAIQLRGMQCPDVWVPDNEDATAPSMRTEGVTNIVEVAAEHGVDFPGEIHPRIVWHRDDPETRHQGFQQMLEIGDPNNEAVDYIDGFVVPEVGDIDDWKKADEFISVVEATHGLEEGSLSMSVIIESAEAELAMEDLREEVGKPSNNLERLFLLVDGEVDYTKDMRAMTPTGELPPWPELRHNTSRGASAAGLIAVDGPFDDIRDVEGYHKRMTENRSKGMTGIWSLTPTQVVEANMSPLPPKSGKWILEVDDRNIELEEEDNHHSYEGEELGLEKTNDGTFVLRIGNEEHELTENKLHEELLDLISYVPSMNDIVDSMEKFEEAKQAGRGAIAMTQSITLVIHSVEVDIEKDRMWDEATYQAAQTPILLFQDVLKNRQDQYEELEEIYGGDVVERARNVGA